MTLWQEQHATALHSILMYINNLARGIYDFDACMLIAAYVEM